MNAVGPGARTDESDSHASSDRSEGSTAFPEIVDVTPSPGTRADRDAEFATFMASAQRDLLHTAWLLVGEAHRAEELAQHALVRTYAAWPRARRDPFAYTRRVLVNLRTDTWRRRRREVLVPPERLPQRLVAADEGIDHRDELATALGRLTARQRRVVVLRYLLDLPEDEVAADLGVSVGTVKSTASRALAQLRTVMTIPDGRGGSDEHSD